MPRRADYQPRVPGPPLKGPVTSGRDPAAVEVAGLGHDAIVIDPGLVDPPGVERDVAGDGLVAGQRPGIGPGGLTTFAPAGSDGK